MKSDAISRIRWAALAVLVVVIALLLLSSTYRPILLGGPGLAQGALIAAIAIGVVLTYRGSGVVNIANGAIAMFAAYVYRELRAEGDLLVPPLPNPLSVIEGVVHRFQSNDTLQLPDIPTRISIGPNMQFWPALALTLILCVLLGFILHVAVFRPLRGAPVLGKVVASVGVLLLLQAIVLRRFGGAPKTVPAMPFVDKNRVDLGFTSVTKEQLFVVCFVILCSVALWLVFAKTRFGLATRAAAENERGAVCLGLSPNTLAAVNWILSCVVTGLLGVFVASINSNVDPVVIPALIVPAMTAALVGGFTSFGLTTLTAFLLGMQVPVIQALGVRESWYPKAGAFAIPGVENMIPLLVIVLTLFLRGNALPQRGASTLGQLPQAPAPSTVSTRFAGPVAALVALAAALFWLTPDFRGALTNSLIGMIACLSVVVVTGYVGQLSLAPLAFGGIAAFTVAELSHDQGWPFPLPIIVGMVAAVCVGLLVAVPAFRIRGVSLAIVTIAFALACDKFVFDNENVNGGLARAVVDVPPLIDQSRSVTYRIAGVITAGDGKQPNPMTTVFCLAVVVVLCYVVANLRRSNTGRHMLAVRTNERAAAAAGVNVAGTKALSFAIAAAIAGLGGCVIAYRSGSADQDRFTYSQSLLLFAFAYLGGITRVSGAVVGGFLVSGGVAFTFAERSLGVPPEFGLLIGGVGLVVSAVLNPEGIAAKGARTLGSLVRRRRLA